MPFFKLIVLKCVLAVPVHNHHIMIKTHSKQKCKCIWLLEPHVYNLLAYSQTGKNKKIKEVRVCNRLPAVRYDSAIARMASCSFFFFFTHKVFAF